ncbi:NADH-quinone oxidoreductase [Panaeolus papilionaceus]|nr:NADH-quinone oxidoreductase [Panaeolus papilionaceus]
MCFASKSQKKNFSDGPEKETKSKPSRNGVTENGTKGAPSSTVPSQTQSAPKTEQPPSDSAPVLPPVTTTSESTSIMAPKVAIVIYSMYGHIATLAEAQKKGIESAGGTAEILQVPETLPQEVLTKMYAPAKPDYPIITPDILATYDAFLLGIPTRYGNMPAQWKSFWDATGQLWAGGKLAGKYAGVFVSTAGPGGGQESTVINTLSTLAHHGILYVPFGYSHAFSELSNVDEVHGGSPWGAGTFAGNMGARQPSPLEREVSERQGKAFWNTVSKVSF